MNKVIVPVLLLAMVVIVSGCTTPQTEDNHNENDEHHDDDGHDHENDKMKENDKMSEKNTGEKKTFVLGGVNFKFTMDGVDNPEIRVKEGDTVRIEFTSDEGFHDWVVDEFSAATEQVRTGGNTFVEFVADKKGTFEYYCSVGSHRAQGMKGNLIVE